MHPYHTQRISLLDMHPQWLEALGHECQFCGKQNLGQTRKNRYGHYAFHHADSDAYGNEKPGYNYLLVCRRCHWFVHLLGGELTLKEGAVRRQNAKAKKRGGRGSFPNALQRGFNLMCRYPGSWLNFAGMAFATAGFVAIAVNLLTQAGF